MKNAKETKESAQPDPRGTPPPGERPWTNVAWVRGLVETAVDSIITIDAEGRIEFFNSAAERMFGYAREETLGKNVRMLMPAPHAESHDEYIARYRRTGEARIIGKGRKVEGRRKDGAVFPIHLSVSEVRVGDRVIFTGIIRDISEEAAARNALEAALAELRERNKKITCLYGIAEVIRRDPSEADMFAEVAGLIQAACHDPERTRARIVFDDQDYGSGGSDDTAYFMSQDIVVGERKRGRVELFYRNGAGDGAAEASRAADLDLIEAIARGLGDNLERRIAEAQLIQASKLVSIGELAAGVGHEINNPVNGIINCADILIEDAEPGSKNRQFAELIRGEADRVAVIVRNLLTFSGRQEEGHRLVRIGDVIDTVLSLCRKRISRSHIDLRVEAPEDLPRIPCRGDQIQQVLMNLLLNAVHALDERFPESDPDKVLRIAATTMEIDGRPHVRLTVEDRGEGIAPAHLARLFEPFFTTKGRDKGTGLGLSVSAGIVKSHGGRISVVSERGRYARFHVDLPLSEAGGEGDAA